MLRPFVMVLEWAAVLVIIFYPVHKRIARKLNRQSLAAIISSTLVIAVVVLPVAGLSIALANELRGLAQTLPADLGQLSYSTFPVIGVISKWISEHLPGGNLQLEPFLTQQFETAATAVLGYSVGLLGNMVGAIAKVFFVIITMYYLFRDGKLIVRRVATLLPLSRAESGRIIDRINEVVSASVYGVIVIAAIQGLLGGLVFWILGVPSPILWGVVLALVCMIPIAGSFIVWVPASIYLILIGSWIKGVVLIVIGTLVISTVDNFLRPAIIRNQTKLHELLVFFSVLGGLSVFGLIGIVLGPVILAVTLALLRLWSAPAQRRFVT